MPGRTRHPLDAVLLATLALVTWTACAPFPGRPASDSPQRRALHMVRSNCGTCHNPQGSAPFDLLTADDVRRNRQQIERVLEAGWMPPQLPRTAAHDLPMVYPHRELPKSKRDFLLRWIEAGAPEPAVPPPPLVNRNQLARHRQPDLVLRGDETLTIPAEGNGIVHTFVFPTDLDEPQYITDLRFDPGVPRLHFNALMIADTTGRARRFDERYPEAGYPSMGSIGFNISGSLGGHFAGGGTPWTSASQRLPRGADIAVEVMFHPTGKPEVVKPTLAVYFEEEQRRPITTLAMGTLCIDIPPGVTGHRLEDSLVLPVDVDLVGLLPKARYLCRTMEVSITPPGAATQRILDIPDWNPKWQEPFQVFGGLRGLPAGTRVDMTFTYDNSRKNPRNPHHPPRRATRGARPDDELCRLLLYVIPTDLRERETLEAAHSAACQERIQRFRQWREENR